MGTPVTTASGHVTYICLSLEEACILQLWRLVLSSLRGSTGCSAPWEFFFFTFVSLGHCGFLFALDNNNTDFLKTFREATLC